MAKLPWYLKQIGKPKLSRDNTLEFSFRITKIGKIYLFAKVAWEHVFAGTLSELFGAKG